MPELWILLISLGAAARITRLITGDILLAWLRAAIIRRFGPESLPADFIKCPWCVGFWVSLAVTAAAFCPAISHHQAYLIVATALTGSWLIGLIARNLDPQH